MRTIYVSSRALAALVLWSAAVAAFAQKPVGGAPAGLVAHLGGAGMRHGSQVSALALSRDGKWLASGGWDNKVKIWEAATGRLVQEFPAARGGLEFSPDGTLLAVEVGTGINLVETATGKTLRKVTGTRGRFSEDSKRLATSQLVPNARTYTVSVFAVDSGKLVRTWGAYPGSMEAFAFSPDGKLLAGGCQDGIIYLWDAQTGKETGRLIGHRNEIQCVRIASDGSQLLSAAHDGSCRLWDLASSKEVHCFGRALAEADSRFVKAAGFAPDGKSIYMLGLNGCRQYELTSGRELQRLPGNNTSYSPVGLALSADAQLMATLSGPDGSIHLWDLVTGQERGPVRPASGVSALALASDGRTVALAANNQSLVLWDAEAGKPLHILREPYRIRPAPLAPEPGEGFRSTYTNPGNVVRTLAFSPDGTLLASGGGQYDTSVSLWDVQTGRERHALLGHAYTARQVQFLSDGKSLLTIAGSNFLHRWETATGKQVERQHNRAEIVGASANGELLAVRSFDPNGRSYAVALQTTAGRKSLAELTADTGFGRMTLSPDGRWLAALINDDLRLWNASVGQLVRQVKLPPAPPQPALGLGLRTNGSVLQFSPDNRMVAVARNDRVVHLYETVTGQERRKLNGSSRIVVEASYSPDGRYFAAADADGSVLVWDVGGLPKTAALAPDAWNNHWHTLALPDAAKADAAVTALLQSGEQTAKELGERLKPAAAPNAARLAALLADLDDKQFAARQRAADELEKLGGLARPVLQKALDGQPSLEVRQRLEAILQKVNGQTPSAETLRAVRALEVLERLDSAESRQLIKSLAAGAAGAALTDEARAAQQRLQARLDRQR